MSDMSETPVKETLGFQAEVKQLLHLMIHSLYGNKEIFLRELVSNGSDACDKLRFDAISDSTLIENDRELQIRVSYDKPARTITVADNGIGMSRQEVVDHIGTIAKSGTREFFQTLTSDTAKDAHADRPVRRRLLLLVHRRRPGDAAHPAGGAHRRSRRPLGEQRRGRLQHRDRHQGDARHRGDAAPAAGRGRAAVRHTPPRDPAEVLGSHHHPDPDEEGAMGCHRARAGDDRRGRADQPGLGAVGAAEVGDHRRAVSRVLQARGARFRAAARLHPLEGRRAGRNTPSCCSFRSGRRTTCGIASTATASSSTSAASSSWTMPNS